MGREELKRRGYTDEEIDEIIEVYELEMQYGNTYDGIIDEEV